MKQKACVVVLISLAAAAAALAQPQHSQSGTPKPAHLMQGYGRHHHPIATTSPEAQKFFDQGLELAFGFNHAEAVRSFERAAELDPKAAMPYWGMAWALGPNYNVPAIPFDEEQKAFEAVKQAQARDANSPQPERDYIAALAQRYSSDPNVDRHQLGEAFHHAMGELARKYYDDLDAATIYAESGMNLRPWHLYAADGTPAEGTDEIVAVLESVIRRDPNHPGANHYYIHAVEASRTPERALASANRLGDLVPAAGHLVHMPSHIYAHTGDWEASAIANARASEADRTFIEETGVATGIYPLMYYSHNLHFLAISRAMQGRYEDALAAAKLLSGHVSPALLEMPMVEAYAAIEWEIEVRFRQWDQILRVAKPDDRLTMLIPLYHFSRGAALAGKGQAQEAETEKTLFAAAIDKVPPDARMGMLDPALAVLAVAGAELDARVARARGDLASEIGHWQKAVELQDALQYSEPPIWFPVRESLGGALLRKGDAAAAEAVFRADLAKNARNGRSLLGLYEALRRQGKDAAASWVKMEFDSTWPKGAEQVSADML